MTRTELASQPYNALLKEIKFTLKTGFMAAQKALEYQRLKTYWTIGRQINVHLKASNGALVLNDALYRRIGTDIHNDLGLALSKDSLRRMIQFGRNYPAFPHKTTLSFTHYIVLQRISDGKKRASLEQRAIKQNMSCLQVKDIIMQPAGNLQTPAQKSNTLPAPARGVPYVYCLRYYTDEKGAKSVRIDCGFKLDVPLEGNVVGKNISALGKDAPRAVKISKSEEGYRAAIDKNGYAKMYTYGAYLERVVDGDTLDVRIDVGFGIGLRERLRLKGINAPEAGTHEGRMAKKFLSGYLGGSKTFVIRTERKGKYGRWLADIFVLKGSRDPYLIARDGEYLNQLLLDKGLAQRYS